MSILDLLQQHAQVSAQLERMDDVPEAVFDAAVTNIEKIEKKIVATRCDTLFTVAQKLRIAVERQKQIDPDFEPEWKLVESAMRDILAMSSVSTMPAASLAMAHA
jgi:hypothetical protein